jgi:hypothetical protein
VDKRLLAAGDVVAIAAVTVIGFWVHGGPASPGRMAATFLPLTVAWFLVGALFRVFDPVVAADRRALWRPPAAMLLAAPLAAYMRAVVLDVPIVGVFVAVLAATSALGMTVWRAAWSWTRPSRRERLPEAAARP